MQYALYGFPKTNVNNILIVKTEYIQPATRVLFVEAQRVICESNVDPRTVYPGVWE